MTETYTIGMIGLDTSHAIEFTRFMQGDTPDDQKLDGLRVANCMRFLTPFIDEKALDERQAQLETWGVRVTDSLAETIDGVDGIMIEINDPAYHLEHFRQVAGLGKPIFLDKPLAGNMEDGKAIVDMARQENTTIWSSSALRFMPQLVAARNEISDPVLASVYGPLGDAPAGSDLIWYGVHTIEMLTTAMGTGATHVWAKADDRGVVQLVRYADGRRGVAECNKKAYLYGGRVQSDTALSVFQPGPDENIYAGLMTKLRDFFLNGVVPVPLEESLEILAIMDAAERSLASGQEEALRL